MSRFRVTYRIVDTIVAEVEIDGDDASIGDFIEAAYVQHVSLPSIDAEIEDAIDWERIDA